MLTPSAQHSDRMVEVNHINSESISQTSPSAPYWKKFQLGDQQGRTEFDLRKICKDISFTRSQCFFRRDYHACINYSEATTLLIFGLKGYSSFRCCGSDRKYNIGPGEVWLVRNNKEPLYRITPAGQENEMVVIKFASHRLDSIVTEDMIGAGSRIIRLGQRPTPDQGLFNLMNNELKTATNRLLAESQALALLARWLEPISQECRVADSIHTTQLSVAEARGLQKIIESLTSDLTSPPSLHELAQQVHMSHTKLNRCFKKAFGTTVYSWLRLYRLESASRYLDDDQSKITDIALQCGFSSASHFAHTFKLHYGCSPIEYRERARVSCS